jgi:hypothetical protein
MVHPLAKMLTPQGSNQSQKVSNDRRFTVGHDFNSSLEALPVGSNQQQERQSIEPSSQALRPNANSIVPEESSSKVSPVSDALNIEWIPITYRVRGIPGNLNEVDVRQCMAQVLGIKEADAKIQSFALDAIWEGENPRIVATASFRITPELLSKGFTEKSFHISNPSDKISWCLVIDKHFHGFTPLSPGNDHTIE